MTQNHHNNKTCILHINKETDTKRRTEKVITTQEGELHVTVNR